MRFLTLAALAMTALAGCFVADSYGGWGGGGCPAIGPVGPFMDAFARNGLAAPRQPSMIDARFNARADGWYDDQPDWRVYYRGGTPLAGFHPSTGEFYELVGGAWRGPKPAPWVQVSASGEKSDPKPTAAAKPKPHCSCGADGCHCKKCKCSEGHRCSKECQCGKKSEALAPTVRNFGLDLTHLGGPERTILNGTVVPKADALHSIQGGDSQVPDDAAKLRLTVIGPEAERSKVLADLASSELRDRLVIQGYEPGNWAVKDVGFKTDGHPTIYLQAPDGKVLHRQDDYQGGIGQLVEAIRKADPNYQPTRDPNVNQPAAPTVAGFPLWAVALGGILLFLFLARKPQ